MMHAMWLGSVFGPFLVILGLWMLFCRSAVMKTETSFKGSPACLYIVSTVRLWVGLLIVNTCCMGPVQGLSLLLAILGWVLIIRAVLFFFVPKLTMKVLGNAKWNASCSIITLIWGIAICWMSFM